MSNEHWDVAQDPAFDLGVDALHGMGPDVVLMRAEEGEVDAESEDRLAKANCLWSILMAVTWETRSVEMIRDRLGVLVSTYCPHLLPAEPLWKGHKERARARKAWAQCPGISWEADAGRVMLRMLTKDGWKARAVGMKALELVYYYQQDESLRPPIARSFEAIGEAIDLKAENKRSAVSAALKRGPLERELTMQRLREKPPVALKSAWFMKSAECREALREAMEGKTNRLGSREEHAELAETLQGVPVKPEFQRMRPAELRRYFEGLEREQERRRAEREGRKEAQEDAKKGTEN